MQPLPGPVHRFTHISPIYNWIYPVAGVRRRTAYDGDTARLLQSGGLPSERPRALYLHVPFCQTICSFCPLVKGPLESEDWLDTYVGALLAEIALKGRDRELTRLPIRTIFFGGGTPSLLRPHQIARIGAALNAAFDLSGVEEFSVEMEVKSVTPEGAAAFRAIGVTHARFGVQSFAQRHRQAFNLTASIAQIETAAAVLRSQFPHVSCDLLYGMNGQTGEEFLDDIERACALGLDNIDFYPLNVMVTQKKLHRHYQMAGLKPISGLGKLYMTRVLREMMRSHGFLPHNGHGFVRVDAAECARNPVTTQRYAFKYHETVYGTDAEEFIGLGNGAESYIRGRTIENETSRERYVAALQSDAPLAVSVVDHPDDVNAGKSVAIALPYLGRIARARVAWDRLAPGTTAKLETLERLGLIACDDDMLRLTPDGWLWYANMMYYLAPRAEQAALAAMMLGGQRGRMDGAAFEALTAVR